jgi:crotonobetainyl-CoA:carnitine CoA-transferase CaiB-like acyl-CoA transferase
VEPPLSRIRVLDLGRIVTGPLCSFFLASLGAEVIRIDPPGGSIDWRFPPFAGPGGMHGGPRGERDLSLVAMRRGRGKKSITLALDREQGREVFRRLVAASDVLVENFRPGVMEALGLGYPALSALHPGLVYCAISAFGQDGPYRDRAGMDLVVQAMSGLMAKTGFPDGPPTKVGVTIGDQVPAILAVAGILAALRQRDRDGAGQLVDVSMMDALVSMVWDEPVDLYRRRGMPERSGNVDPRGVPINTYRTRDGWITMVLASDAQWPRLCALIGRPEWGDDPEFAQGLRVAHAREIDHAIERWTSARSTDEAEALCVAEGLPVGAVRPPWSAKDDPQVAARRMLEPLRHPDPGAPPTGFLGARLPIVLSETPLETAPAEPLGASTERVLAAVAGLPPAEIARLREQGVI